MRLRPAAVVLAMVLSVCGAAPVPSAWRSPASSSAPTPTPSLDPASAEVRAATERFIRQVASSAATGDAKSLDALIEPRSPAGDVETVIDSPLGRHIGHVYTTLTLSNWDVHTDGQIGLVSVTWAGSGHDASWPSMKPLQADHQWPTFNCELVLVKSGTRWLVRHFDW
jgi:hypothetical protein